jgi:hypothetical protein
MRRPSWPKSEHGHPGHVAGLPGLAQLRFDFDQALAVSELDTLTGHDNDASIPVRLLCKGRAL